MTNPRDEFLSEEDLGLRHMSEDELFATWALWLEQAQATNDAEADTYSHGIFLRKPSAPAPAARVAERQPPCGSA